jgi:hypothetical protein
MLAKYELILRKAELNEEEAIHSLESDELNYE